MTFILAATKKPGLEKLPHMEVTANKDVWPLIQKKEDLKKFHGVGELRRKGYDVKLIEKFGVVHELS